MGIGVGVNDGIECGAWGCADSGGLGGGGGICGPAAGTGAEPIGLGGSGVGGGAGLAADDVVKATPGARPVASGMEAPDEDGSVGSGATGETGAAGGADERMGATGVGAGEGETGTLALKWTAEGATGVGAL